jgi:hypothetical protein
MGETEERNYMQLVFDDGRPAPEGWTLAKDYWQAISMLEDNWGELEELSLDHDISSFDPLDQKEYTGQDIVNWMEGKAHAVGGYPKFSVTIHSQNQAGAENMARGLFQMGLRTMAKETLYPQPRDYIVPLSWFGKEYTTLLAYAAITASEQADKDEDEDY